MHATLIRFLAFLALLPGAAVAQTTAAQDAEPAVFATIGEAVVTRDEFFRAFRQGVRQKFYHGKVPAKELDSFARDIARQMVDRHLLLAEARRREVQPDEAWIKERLDGFIENNQDKPVFQTHREQVVQRVRDQLEARSLLRQFEAQYRDEVEIGPEEVRAYYEANPDVFTEPEQVRVGLILLRVDPGANSEAWMDSRDRAAALLQEIRDGADFAELAREHSDDPSAELGGDMGYLHKGMLGQYAQGAIDKLDVGDISEPVALLEGAALMKLIDRRAAVKVPFDRARERATGLALADKKDRRWEAFIEELRARQPIEIDESVFAQIRASASGNADQQPANEAN